MASENEKRFDTEMMKIYHRARDEAKYNATRYFHMLIEQGGLRAAQTLIHSTQVSEGYTALWERKRLDLTVEALILKPDWRELFTSEELDIAQQRLQQYGYEVPVSGS